MRQELGDLNDAEAVDKVLSVAGLNVIDEVVPHCWTAWRRS